MIKKKRGGGRLIDQKVTHIGKYFWAFASAGIPQLFGKVLLRVLGLATRAGLFISNGWVPFSPRGPLPGEEGSAALFHKGKKSTSFSPWDTNHLEEGHDLGKL